MNSRSRTITYSPKTECNIVTSCGVDLARAGRKWSSRHRRLSAEDFIQEASIALVRAERKYGAVPLDLRRAVIRNAMSNAARNSKRRRDPGILTDLMKCEMFLPGDGPSDATIEKSEVRHMIREWVSNLPRHLQTLYKALFERGLSRRETAEVLSVSEARVSQLVKELTAIGRRDLRDLAA